VSRRQLGRVDLSAVRLDPGETLAGCPALALGANAVVVVRLQQRKRVEAEPPSYALEALERQVALASLHTAHVRAVDAEYVGERLLAEALAFSMGPEVAAEGAL
jgi:hypothetical protein